MKNNQSIIQVLKDLNVKRYHLAFVKNEKGEFIGMITLEDIVEEIVGEITDEFDNELRKSTPCNKALTFDYH